MPEVKLKEANDRGIRVFVGGCVERGDGSSFRRKAHAHCHPTDPYRNWICIRSAKRLYTELGNPSRIVWEEIAHCFIPYSNGHNATFHRKVKELSGRLLEGGKQKIARQRTLSRRNRKRKIKKKGDKPMPK